MKIVFSWNELPAYGARLIKAGIDNSNYTIDVIATIPTIPIKGMDEIIGQKINWIDSRTIYKWSDLGLEIPDIFFQAGWYIASFVNLGKQVKNNGGKVILLSDNCWKNTMRQWVGSIYYRLIYKNYFDGVWVPGKSGIRLMNFYGVKKDTIFNGLYGIDPISFPVGKSLVNRPKSFIFVGKLINEKGIPQLIRVFNDFYKNYPDWRLYIYGNGPLYSNLLNLGGIFVNEFCQPHEISKAMQNSRFLILPTLTDHWPLVVNEAALSGCGLILSDRVGNKSEFVGKNNGIVYEVEQDKDLLLKMILMANQSDEILNQISKESRMLGENYTPTYWSFQFNNILEKFKNK